LQGEFFDAEENLSTKQPTLRKNTRISRADEDSRRPTGSQIQTGQGSQARGGRALLSARVLVLRNAREFRTVYERGAKRLSRSFVVFAAPNGLGESRFGLTAPRKLGKAHERNRIKRRIREMIRRSMDRIPAGFDLVINPRRSVLDRPFEELRSELLSILCGTS